MVKSRQQTARKPASKYANLRKKMQKQKTQSQLHRLTAGKVKPVAIPSR